ncbi:MAG: hypothetical protein AAGK14_06910 [Verrucomicrobiota bacterium]
MKPLTKREVRAVITAFWELNASRAPIKAFEEIVDTENLSITMRGTDIAFHGIAGFADHQIGKLIFFDQKFVLRKLESTINGGEATARTEARWHARTWTSPAPYSHELIADLRHTWTLRRCPRTGRALMRGHVCERLKYRPGHGPEDTPKDFHLTVGK